MSGAIPHSPNTPAWRGAQLEHRDNFTFYLYQRRRKEGERTGSERSKLKKTRKGREKLGAGKVTKRCAGRENLT